MWLRSRCNKLYPGHSMEFGIHWPVILQYILGNRDAAWWCEVGQQPLCLCLSLPVQTSGPWSPPRAGARTILLLVQCGFRTFTKLIHVKLWGVHLVKRVTCMALMFHTVIRTRFLFLMYGEALAKRDSRVIWEIIICKEQCCHKAYVRFQLA